MRQLKYWRIFFVFAALMLAAGSAGAAFSWYGDEYISQQLRFASPGAVADAEVKAADADIPNCAEFKVNAMWIYSSDAYGPGYWIASVHNNMPEPCSFGLNVDIMRTGAPDSCAAPYMVQPTTGSCSIHFSPIMQGDQSKHTCEVGPHPMVGDPIDAATGNVYISHTDWKSGAEDLRFKRYYNSAFSVNAWANGQSLSSFFARVGVDWTFNYEATILANSREALKKWPF